MTTVNDSSRSASGDMSVLASKMVDYLYAKENDEQVVYQNDMTAPENAQAKTEGQYGQNQDSENSSVKGNDLAKDYHLLEQELRKHNSQLLEQVALLSSELEQLKEHMRKLDGRQTSCMSVWNSAIGSTSTHFQSHGASAFDHKLYVNHHRYEQEPPVPRSAVQQQSPQLHTFSLSSLGKGGAVAIPQLTKGTSNFDLWATRPSRAPPTTATVNTSSLSNFSLSTGSSPCHTPEEQSTSFTSYPSTPTPESYTFADEGPSHRTGSVGSKKQTYDWGGLVRKVINMNDQSTSLFIQQKLKSCSKTTRSEIMAEVAQLAYQLSVNPFGNFVVQKCLETATPDQVESIAQCIVGKALFLSMHHFACHVVQTALDYSHNPLKISIIEELLCDVKTSVLDKYGSHVWQKVLCLVGSGNPSFPQLMTRINQALDGQWLELASTEPGSLVIQSIFENCTEQHKAPCIDELINNFDKVICNQYGHYIVQHMVQHASEPYRSQVLGLILERAADYSLDTWAGKVVETMVKLDDTSITNAYLKKISIKVEDRQRLPLVDSEHSSHIFLAKICYYCYYLLVTLLRMTNQLHQTRQDTILSSIFYSRDRRNKLMQSNYC